MMLLVSKACTLVMVINNWRILKNIQLVFSKMLLYTPLSDTRPSKVYPNKSNYTKFDQIYIEKY